MDMFESIANGFVSATNYFIGMPIESYINVAFIILGVAGVSAITQLVKKVMKLTSEKVIVTVFTGISLVATLLATLISSAEVNPLILGEQTAAVMGIALPLYKFAIKPLSMVVSQFQLIRTPIEQKLAEVDALIPQSVVDQVKAIATPTTEVSITDTPVLALTNKTVVPVPKGTVVLTETEPQAQKDIIVDF